MAAGVKPTWLSGSSESGFSTDTLESPQREKWLNDILTNLGIKMSFYRSKYRQPISDMPSECNKAFADALREIFGK